MLRASSAGLALLVVATGVAWADCDHFKWSVARELSLFKDAPEPVEAGAAAALDHAYAVTLKPNESAGFPVPPERGPKPGTFGGVLNLASVDSAGLYDVTVSEEAWVDVVQAGTRV